MIKKFCYAAMAAVAAVSCCEKSVELPEYEESEELVTFSVSVPGAETKNVGTAIEKTVNSLQVIVFNKHGLYETSSYVTRSTVDLTCTAGEKRLIALVNANKEDNIKNVDDLASRPLYLRETGEGDLVMLGDTTMTVSAGAPITIDVSYLSAKISLTSVSLQFEDEQHKDLACDVKAVFLTNVAGDRKYMTPSTPSVWFNEGAYDSTNTLPFLHDWVNYGQLVSGEKQYNTKHYFYCYPNETDTKTRLVIETEIEGQTYYYPIELKKVVENNEYSYSVILTRFGTDRPDGSLDKGSYSVKVSMKSWVTNSSTLEI